MEDNTHPLAQTLAPKHKLNKANIVMAVLFVLALAAAITFGILWATKKTDAPVAENNTTGSTEASQASTSDCQASTTQSDDKECSCPELIFSEDAIVNKQENTSYGASISDTAYSSAGPAITASSHWDKTVNLWINWDEFTAMFTPNERTSAQIQTYEINFNQNVIDIFLAAFGQSVSEETFLFLLEDGTVEYMPLQTVAKTKEIKSYGKVPGLFDIKKFYRGSSRPVNGYMGGGVQSYAQSADGKIYQLYTILQDAGAWS